MIKGVGKQIVLLNNTDSEIFEQAIFILRSSGKIPYQDMIKECEKMINNHIQNRKNNGSKNGWKIGFFILLTLVIILGICCIIK